MDGMRGVAALAVVVHHAAPATGSYQLLRSGYLAVDFFFMLSGFVLARAYEDRFARGLATRTFLLIRWRRLWPVLAVGILIGGALQIASGKPVNAVAVVALREMLFVPRLAGNKGVYFLDGVQWSLLFELLANVAHPSILRRLGRRALSLFTLLMFGWLSAFALSSGSAAVGSVGSDFVGGVPRVMFAYSAGVLIYRLMDVGLFSKAALPGVVPIILLPVLLILAGFMRTFLPGVGVDLVVVGLFIPALLIAGAKARLNGWLRGAGKLLGSLSYPLYAVHLPIIGFTVLCFGGGLQALLACCTLAVAVAYITSIALEPNQLHGGPQKGPSGRSGESFAQPN